MQQSTLNIYDEDNDDNDGPKPAVTIGPSMPPEFLKAPESPVDDGDDDNGPDLTPHLRKGGREEADPSMPTPGPSTEKRQVGPTLPSYAPTYDPTTYHNDDGVDDDDDDDFGPKPLPAGMQHQQTDGVKEFIEREEKRRKLAEVCMHTKLSLPQFFFDTAFQQDAAKPKSLQRDEWILVPPSSSSLLGSESIKLFPGYKTNTYKIDLDPTKLKARQFSRGSGPVNNKSKKDNSLWTETPAERQQRLADEV